MAAKFFEMEYYSFKYGRDIRYQSFFSSLHEFKFMTERLGLNRDHVKWIRIDDKEMDVSRLFERAEGLQLETEEFYEEGSGETIRRVN